MITPSPSALELSMRRSRETGELKNSCPLCKSRHLTLIWEIEGWAHFTIQKCRGCGFVHADPRPDTEELARFYTSSYFRRQQETAYGYADYRSMAESNAKRMWHDLQSYIPYDRSDAKVLLDVGCATGGFLSEAQSEAWNCTGVELSEYAVDVARKEFNLHVLQGDIFLPALKINHFSLITFWHVLEHLLDPVATLRKAHTLLAPGGILFIELPNWNSLGRRIKGKAWNQLKPPEHINYFTLRTLHKLASEAGFRVIKCTSEYPSVMNEAAVQRWSRPFYQAKAMVASLACKVGCGGYARLLAAKV